MIPGDITDITADWLSAALGPDVLGGGRVSAVTVDDIGTGVGVFGAIGRLHLTYDAAPPEAPASLIAKLPTPAEANRQVGMALRLYEREGRFFEELASTSGLRTPRCYVNQMDIESGRFVLLLEDLAHMEAGDQLAGLSVARAEAIIDAIAPLHARYWDAPELTTALDWVPRQDDPMFLAGIPPIVAAGVARLEPLLPTLPAGSWELAQRINADFESLIVRCAAGPHTFIHGDLRLDNLFFEPGSDAPAIIDWQLSLRNRAAYDLVWLVATSMEPELQDAHLEHLIGHFHEALARQGVAYPLADLRTALAEQAAYLLSGPLSLIGTFDFAEAGDGRAAELTARWVRRGFNAALRFGSAEVL